MGIKGTVREPLTTSALHVLLLLLPQVRRNYDGQIINANVDTDVMLSEEPPYGL